MEEVLLSLGNAVLIALVYCVPSYNGVPSYNSVASHNGVTPYNAKAPYNAMVI